MYGDLIPVSIQDRLIFLRDSMTSANWEVGDITLEVIRWNKQNGKIVSLEAVYSAVGLFVGKSSRSVREFCYLSGSFAPEIRERFSPLAYDHFRHAAALGPASMIGALEWALMQTDVMGRPATVDSMVAKFSPAQPGEPEPPPFAEETPFEMIHRMVSRQVSLVEGWIGYDLPVQVRCKVAEYYQAAKDLQAAIEGERVTA